MGKLRPGKVKVIAGSDNYPKGYHEGDPGGLDAVDADLAPANIADGVTIFGKLGTLAAGALAEDTDGDAETTLIGVFDSGYSREIAVADGTDVDIVTVTPTFDASSLAFAALCCGIKGASSLKLRLYMGGVQVAETAYLTTVYDNWRVTAFRALSGAQICKGAIHAYAAGQNAYAWTEKATTQLALMIAVGSVKLV